VIKGRFYVLCILSKIPIEILAMIIGILALQGNFSSHADIINSLGGKTCFVKVPEQLNDIDGLILPGDKL
jgi:hypothetical protein